MTSSDVMWCHMTSCNVTWCHLTPHVLLFPKKRGSNANVKTGRHNNRQKDRETPASIEIIEAPHFKMSSLLFLRKLKNLAVCNWSHYEWNIQKINYCIKLGTIFFHNIVLSRYCSSLVLKYVKSNILWKCCVPNFMQ